MSEKVTKKVRLTKAFTWAGINYAPGQNDLPEAAANYAVKRGFGTIVGEADLPEDFEPLSREETMERFTKGDDSEEVFKSLRFHQAAIAAEREKFAKERSAEDTEKPEDGKTEDGKTGKEITEPDPPKTDLPENFPMRHAFDKLGFKSVEAVQAKTREELIALEGIGESTADKALAYGK